MKHIVIAVVLLAGLCYAQESTDFHPASTNVWAAEYPRVDSSGRIQIRVKAPDANKVRLNFWSGPKVDMKNRRTDSGLLQHHHLFPAFTITLSSSMARRLVTPIVVPFLAEASTPAWSRSQNLVLRTIQFKMYRTAR